MRHISTSRLAKVAPFEVTVRVAQDHLQTSRRRTNKPPTTAISKQHTLAGSGTAASPNRCRCPHGCRTAPSKPHSPQHPRCPTRRLRSAADRHFSTARSPLHSQRRCRCSRQARPAACIRRQREVIKKRRLRIDTRVVHVGGTSLDLHERGSGGGRCHHRKLPPCHLVLLQCATRYVPDPGTDQAFANQ